MSKPAARLGDMTVHGGTITLGFPTVLIGGMPAARIGDMHVCPMMTPGTPPIPHVGGPVSLGSPTVLIGGMPAARVGDMLVCVGPPDTVAMGCFTVLIGEAGSGSASGGGAPGMSAVAGAAASAATALNNTPESTMKEEHWVEFQFVDKAGLPISGVPYRFTGPDGASSEGTLPLNGTVRRDALSEGQCKVELMSVSDAKWSKQKAKVGETVRMSAKVEGFEPGTPATIEVFKRDLRGSDAVISKIDSSVQGDAVEAEWVYEYPPDLHEKSYRSGQPVPSAPLFYFAIVVGECRAVSDVLGFNDTLKIKLVDDDGRPMSGVKYVLYLSNGEIREGTLDSSGAATEKDLPPVKHYVRFPGCAAQWSESP